MSADATGYVIRHSPHTGAEFLCLMMLADSVNDQNDNEFWMSVTNLARKSRVSRSTASEAVKALVADGWIEVLEGTRNPDGSPTGRPGRYLFMYPENLDVVFETRKRGVTAHTTGGVTAETTGVSSDRAGGDRRDDNITQGEPNSETISRPSSSTTDTLPPTESDKELVQRFVKMLRDDGDSIVMDAVDADPRANEILDMARRIAEQPQRMIDRSPIDRFPDGPPRKLCLFFHQQLMIACPTMKSPTISKRWFDEAERMLRIDKRGRDEIRETIEWIFTDPAGSFWISNCQSIPTFRRQYDKIRAQMAYRPAAASRRSSSVQQHSPVAPPQFDGTGAVSGAYRAWELEDRRTQKVQFFEEVGTDGIEEARAAGRLPAWWDEV